MANSISKNNLIGLSHIEKEISNLKKVTSYLEKEEQQQLIEACYFAAKAHNKQTRQSGEPYICHPIIVSQILAKENIFDLFVLQAAVLHDVIEDTPVTKLEVTNLFGGKVAELVDGVSKLEKVKHISRELLQAQTFTKLVNAMQIDPSVVMIKFADRMHNMQTLDSLPPEKQKRIAKETIEIYVPIAQRLGMFVFKSKLEDLAFKYLNPWRYKVACKVAKANKQRLVLEEEILSKLINILGSNIQSETFIRKRNVFSIYHKIKKHRLGNRPIETVSVPIIVITKNINDCYLALGIIHQHFKPIFKKLLDYIASPKVNGYQSIHTTLLTKTGQVVKIQIRSENMHSIAETGIIAIWKQFSQQKQTSKSTKDKPILKWLGNIKNLQKLSVDPIEYYETIKKDLTEFDIQVFTPKGDIIGLPIGSNIIDFAYYIHTDLGDKLVCAKVNNIPVSVDFKLENGQTVELITDKDSHPQAQWLKIIKTGRARIAIRHFFNSIPKKELQNIGFKSLVSFIKKYDYQFDNIQELLTKVAKQEKISVEILLEMIALDEMKKTYILKEFQTILNTNGITKTVKITVDNRPGGLAIITKYLAKTSANIENIYFPNDMKTKEVSILFKIRVTSIKKFDEAIKILKKQKAIQLEVM